MAGASIGFELLNPENLRHELKASNDVHSCLFLVPLFFASVPWFNPPREQRNTNTPQDFIRKLLTVDVDRRMTVEEAERHPWLVATAQSLEAHDLRKNLEEIKIFNAKQKLRAAMKTVRLPPFRPVL